MLKKRIFDTIRNNDLIPASAVGSRERRSEAGTFRPESSAVHVVLGLSGGPDSLALYDALKQLADEYDKTRGGFGLNIVIHPVHVNHKFRPGAAEEDQAFVEKLAQRDFEGYVRAAGEFVREEKKAGRDGELSFDWGCKADKIVRVYPCRSFETDCSRLAEELKMTSEEAGRKARYDAFREVAGDVHGKLTRHLPGMTAAGDAETDTDSQRSRVVIAVAQNADDQTETILFRILRGTGLDGLSGIAYVRTDESGFRVIRPLLDCSRDEIEEYVTRRGLEPRRDHTNEEPVYTRNKIRLGLIPYLKGEFNPNLVNTINRMGASAGRDGDYLRLQAKKAYEEALVGGSDLSGKSLALDVKTLRDLHEAVRLRVYITALSEIGMTENVTSVYLEACDKAVLSDNGNALIQLGQGFRAKRAGKRLIFFREEHL